ncbi:ANR family transcriptional regulator [Serratia ficaria]|uniref:ANR family transcriptional regulator n=1 Tax=Serratia ficaria TaxID=61651 RepID=UPI0021B81D36|nr:ANR family transcriptional regulator [Serratia ficaria]
MKKNNNAYLNIARIAAECEQRGWYEKAAEIWKKSLALAHAIDTPWVNVRIEFCLSAAAHNWGSNQ